MSHAEIVKKQVDAAPVLFIQRRVKRTELQQTFSECFMRVYGHAMLQGATIAGNPMARYVEFGHGIVTVDCMIPLQSAADGDEGEIQAGQLQGGEVAFTTHSGPYEELAKTYAAVEEWMEENKLTKSGAPWEWYITDPGQFPDPKDWKTEVFYPIAP